MRLFTAINFNPETHINLLTLRDELRSHASKGRFTLPENLHLTLVFLGECDKPRTDAIKKAMDAVLFEPFGVVIDCVGCFKRSGGDTWWAGARESKPLMDMRQNLSERLREAGFSLDNRKYSPHITLGREVVTSLVPKQIKPFGETVSKIDLMQSEHIGGKLVYTSIYQC